MAPRSGSTPQWAGFASTNRTPTLPLGCRKSPQCAAIRSCPRPRCGSPRRRSPDRARSSTSARCPRTSSLGGCGGRSCRRGCQRGCPALGSRPNPSVAPCPRGCPRPGQSSPCTCRPCRSTCTRPGLPAGGFRCGSCFPATRPEVFRSPPPYPLTSCRSTCPAGHGIPNRCS